MKTKIIKIIFTVYCLLFTMHSFSQSWQWANSGGSIFPYDEGFSLCQDLSGNIYVTGTIQGSLPSDNTHHYAIFNSDTITVNGENDIFLAKYDSNGNQLWVIHFGGSYDNWTNQKSEAAGHITYNPSTNSIYLTGEFVGSCSIGSHTIYAAGASDVQIFIAKFDLNGTCIWAKSAGSSGDGDGCRAIAVSPSGKVYIAGNTQNTASFDTINISNGGFLAMYDDSGKCQWVKNIFNGINHFPYGAAGSPVSLQIYNNDLFVLAEKNSDSVYVDTVLFMKSNYYSNILARFDSLGNVKWAKQMGGPSAYCYGSLTMDNNGNCYFGNQFLGGYAIFDTDTVYAKDSVNFFFVKYNQNGIFQWVNQGYSTLPPNYDIMLQGASSDINGNVYLTGAFSGNATFGTYSVTANTSEDIFITRYNTSGDCIGVCHAGTGIGYGVLAEGDGSCVVTGSYGLSQPGQWTTQLGSNTLTSYGYDDIFVAKADAITGINEKKQNTNDQLVIYANPTTGKCNITVPDEFLNENNLTLSIFDNNGKLIQQRKLEMNEGKIKLDLDAEAKGIYNATLGNGKKIYAGKIVFE
ncbi:MAG: T9SS type A sorting domain-containing protein [Bacteroidales bacterium]|jgi:hypothetical protein